MRRHGFLAVVVLAASIIAAGWAAQEIAVSANESYRLTGPCEHDNLAICLIHREGCDSGSVSLTLQEALEQGVVKVIETGDVEELVVRNLGERGIFIRSGDMVKGGNQDRALTVSMILPPNSGDVPVGAFCVEQGRWSAGGQENTAEFSASTELAPSKALRWALGERTVREIAPGAESTLPPTRERRRLEG